MVAFDFTDAANKKLWFGRQGTWGLDASNNTGNPAAGTNATVTSSNLLSTSNYRWYFGLNNGAAFAFNFGQRAFAHTCPVGFGGLNTTNIQARGTSAIGKAAIQPNKWMDVNLYGGTAVVRNIVNSGFKPDLIWQKSRSDTTHHRLVDSVRGTNLELYSSLTSAEGNSGSDGIINFNDNGFSMGGGGGSNAAGTSYVAWQWKQSPASGFNIVPYTGTGVGRSISHNLGVTPKFIIVKGRSNAYDWVVWHTDAFAGANTSRLFLNTSDAVQTGQGSGPWNSTSPTSSNFSVGTHLNVNETGVPFIAYLWAEIPGFSKFGSYVGNGSTNGPFVYTGFRPAFILTKNITTGGYWWEMVDNKRSVFNPRDRTLYANVADSQYTSSSYNKDLLSNGFKMRGDSAGHNSSGDTFVYAAFAESPFGLNNRAI